MTEALFEDTRHPTGAPYVADEGTTLCSFLDHHRATLLRQTDGLDHEQLNRPYPPSTMTLAGLLKHMAYVEGVWFGVRFAGGDAAPPFDTAPFDEDVDWDFASASQDAPDELRVLLRAAIARSNWITDGAESLDQLAVGRSREGEPISLRWILVHMIEEYARHCGHADLMREAIDGKVDL
ncbi:putative damage-inducible protein DinB [Nocardioides luteus]|uniref:Mini-circle protein n=1 Tax=Nocardioides luteus TaxID=1844 RepID=A0ABQ5SW53_9ACTN|nr:DinB family protein [Nocardioides luteus]MDR7309319.1 putative damage-inducible protein DinB [Nocardioides luteus]GGR70055.1 mini-circle protein [Nocardioides luteus]GLJ67724.1 mini-circle protein [Nocardioides luteus]